MQEPLRLQPTQQTRYETMLCCDKRQSRRGLPRGSASGQVAAWSQQGQVTALPWPGLTALEHHQGITGLFSSGAVHGIRKVKDPVYTLV